MPPPHLSKTESVDILDVLLSHRRVSHGLGWWASQCHDFYNKFREKQFFTLPVVNDNEIVRSTSDGVESKPGLICLVRYTQSCWCQHVLQILVTLDNG